MKKINISFKELIDYIREKDFETKRLKNILDERNKEIDKLEEEKNLIYNWLCENGIYLVIERNMVFRIPREDGDINA